ncbi:MAG TPA: alpha-ketoglutarate-dependent dioxygenase AlkB [Acidimicrobiales bacterium]|nr:alpha-ketoglutarate-dependent dioxygenase AlkB [Acidimicrobiales bacterium]
MTLTWQPSLLDAIEPDFDPAFASADRRDLGSGAWLEVVPGWVEGADALLAKVLSTASWSEHERPMYDKVVVEPRLTTGLWFDPPSPIGEMADALTERFDHDLCKVSANLYRDGRDSVAWHGDRVGRTRDDTVVAILSLGSARRFLLRPAAGGESLRLNPAPGDLVVLGGTAQTTWQHSIPKVAQAGARVSVMFREAY